MLFRVVRPMKRKNSRSAYFVQRIPADIKHKVIGQRLAIPVGDNFKFITPTASSQAITFSLGTDDPRQVKILQATIAAHIEAIWQALRNDTPAKLTHRQATALAGELYPYGPTVRAVLEASLWFTSPARDGSRTLTRSQKKKPIGQR